MKVKDLFDVRIGFTLHLNALSQAKGDSSINYVSRTGENNGVAARVEKAQNVNPYPAGLLSCAVGGTVLSTFVQDEAFYVSRDMYILTPLRKMSLQEKLYWCLCIKANAYRYCYGRLANKTLANLKLPDEVPAWVYTTSCVPINTKIKPRKLPLHTDRWAYFELGNLFQISVSKDQPLQKCSSGSIPFVSSSSQNNGVSSYVGEIPSQCANTITLARNGSVGSAFFHSAPYCASPDDVRVLTPQFAMTKYSALFICTVLEREKFKYGYGRKFGSKRMQSTRIKLPTTPSGTPDWQFMEQYIKSLPYSDRI